MTCFLRFFEKLIEASQWTQVKMIVAQASWREYEHRLAISQAEEIDTESTIVAYGVAFDDVFLGMTEACLSRCKHYDMMVSPAWNSIGFDVHRSRNIRDKVCVLIGLHLRQALAFATNEELHTVIKVQAVLTFFSDPSGIISTESEPVVESILVPIAVMSMGYGINPLGSDMAWAYISLKLLSRNFVVKDLEARRTGECK